MIESSVAIFFIQQNIAVYHVVDYEWKTDFFYIFNSKFIILIGYTEKIFEIPMCRAGENRVVQCLAKKLVILVISLIKWVFLAKDFELQK